MNSVAVLVSSLLLCNPWAVTAVDADEMLPRTLQGAMEAALANSPELRAVNAQLAGARAKVRELRGEFLPALDIYSDARNARTYDPFSGVNVSGTISGAPVDVAVERVVPRYEVVSGLELSLNVYSGGLTMAHLHEASAEELALHAHQAVVQRDVVLDVAAAYWGLKRAQLEEKLANHALDLARRDERIAEEKWGLGNISALEREIASLRTAEAEVRLASAVDARREQRRRYELVVGIPAQTDVREPDIALTDDPGGADLRPVLALFGRAEPTIAKAVADVEAARARERAKHAEYYPRVDFFIRYSYVGRDDDDFIDATDLSRQDRVIGMRLRWNLFNGGRTEARGERAQADIVAAQARVEQEETNRANLIREKRTLVTKRENEVVLAEKRLNVAVLEERIARVQEQSRRISDQQRRHKRFAVEEASARVAIAKIDLIAARLSLALNEIGSETDIARGRPNSP